MCIKTLLEDKDALVQKKKSKTNNDDDFGGVKEQQQQLKQQKEITYAELRKHNLPWDAWVAIHGKVYDITDYAKKEHPGGDIILLGAGKDATLLYESYHSTVILESLKDSLQVGVMKPGELKESVFTKDSEFYSVMKKRVLARIREKGLTRRGSNEILIKAVLLVPSYWFLYYKLLTTAKGEGFFLLKTAVLCFLWALNGGVLALGLSHDGNHGSFSNYRCLNKLAGWTMEWFGRSAHVWELQHNVSHHPYTNVVEVDKDEKKDNVPSPIEEIDPESDPDIVVSYPLIRFHSHFKILPHHKYQHIYVPILVSFLQLSIFLKDIKEVRANRVHHVDTLCRFADKWNVARFYIMKMAFILYTLLLPIYFHGVTTGLFIFFFGAAIRGQIVATIVIVSHVSEGSSFVLKREENKTEAKVQTVKGVSEMEMKFEKEDTKVVQKKKTVPANDWAACQCQASLNWASGSWFWNHFSGGLNHQIEHHLFPGLCHTLYIHIHDVVRETCEEYGVPYKNHLSLSSIYRATLAHLKLMGTQEIIKQD